MVISKRWWCASRFPRNSDGDSCRQELEALFADGGGRGEEGRCSLCLSPVSSRATLFRWRSEDRVVGSGLIGGELVGGSSWEERFRVRDCFGLLRIPHSRRWNGCRGVCDVGAGGEEVDKVICRG